MKKNNELNSLYSLMEEIKKYSTEEEVVQDSVLKSLYSLVEELETSSNEEDVAEEDFTEADVAEAEYDALIESIPHGGVFRGDVGSATKAQVRAANREWRRRKSTGRFADDGSRWN